MEEHLFSITLDNGQALLLIADKRCVSKYMRDMNRFIIQMNHIISDFGNIIAREVSDLNKSEYIVHLFTSSMVEGGQEYSLSKLSSINLDKYKLGKICIINDNEDTYFSVKYNNIRYGIFI